MPSLARRPAPGLSGGTRWGLVLLLSALAFGVAAALLVAPAGPPAPSSNPAATLVPESWVGFAALGLLRSILASYLLTLLRLEWAPPGARRGTPGARAPDGR